MSKRRVSALGLLIFAWGCASSSLPTAKFERVSFPKDAHIGDVKRPYETLGMVRTKINYPSLDPNREEDQLCQNAFNQAARDLLERARKNKADAIIDLKSVTLLESGQWETHASAQCSDDGQEGQILAQAIAVRWKRAPAKRSASSAPTSKPTAPIAKPRSSP